MGLTMAALHFAGVDEAILLGAFVFALLSISLRLLVPKKHRRGIALYKKKRYAEAIPHFEESYRFFTTNKWVDDFRFLTMFSSSRISYREMALLNVAFCHALAGDGAKSKEYYHQTFTEFPGSEIAKASLKMIDSIERSKTT